MKKTTTSCKAASRQSSPAKPKLKVLPATKGRKVVPFTREQALKYLQNAHPKAVIRVMRTDFYGMGHGSQYAVEVEGPSTWLMGLSFVSVEDALCKTIAFEHRFDIRRICNRAAETKGRH